ncbi:MAG: hypothetical protein AAGC55_00975 [Myxococcota bacterium]
MIGLSTTPRRTARRLYPLFVAVATLLGSACDDETGLIIEISQGDLDESPQQLDFFIGEAGDDDPILASGLPQCDGNSDEQQWFIDITDEADRTVQLNGRNLDNEPYRLMLQPETDPPSDRPLMIVAVASTTETNSDEMIRIGVGRLAQEVAFSSGEVRQWPLELRPLGERDDFNNSCTCADGVIIASADDTDCDLYPTCDSGPECDCNTESGVSFPGAADESCDGVIADCGGESPGNDDTNWCYVRSNIDNRCFFGVRQCDETNPNSEDNAYLGTCEPIPGEYNRVPPPLCQFFENECDPDFDQYLCANNKSDEAVVLYCDAHFDQQGAQCRRRITRIDIRNRLSDLDEEPVACRWSLLGGLNQYHYQAGFVREDGPGGGMLDEVMERACDDPPRFEARAQGDVQNDFFTLIMRYRFEDQDFSDSQYFAVTLEVTGVEVGEDAACQTQDSLEEGFVCFF